LAGEDHDRESREQRTSNLASRHSCREKKGFEKKQWAYSSRPSNAEEKKEVEKERKSGGGGGGVRNDGKI